MNEVPTEMTTRKGHALKIDITQLSAAQQYKLITSTVVPRPIALVTTFHEDTGHNAAPYSFFNAMGEDPPIFVLGLEDRPGSSEVKDTTWNIRETGEFVINLVDQDLGPAMNTCAIAFPKGVSEISEAGLHLLASEKVKPHRIDESPVSFECQTVDLIRIAPRRFLAIGRAVFMHVRDGLFDSEKGYISPDRYKPLGRYFGKFYVKDHALFEMEVPSVESWNQNKKSRGD